MNPFPSNGQGSGCSCVSPCTSPPVDKVSLNPDLSRPKSDRGPPLSLTKVLEVGDLAVALITPGKLCITPISEKLRGGRFTFLENGGNKILDFDVMNHNTLVLVNSDNQVKVYEVSGRKSISCFNLIGSPNAVKVLSHCLIAVGMTSGAVELVTWDKLKLTSTDFTPGNAINRQGSITSISGDDNRVLTTSSDGCVKIWDVASFICWKSFRFPSSSSILAIMGSKHFLICVSRGNVSSTSVYTADTFKRIFEMDHAWKVISVIFSSGEDRFITLEKDFYGGLNLFVRETNTGLTKWYCKNILSYSDSLGKLYEKRVSIFSEGRIGVSNDLFAQILRPPLQVATQLDRPFFERNDAMSQSFPPLQSGLIRVLKGSDSPMLIVEEFIRPGQRMYSLPEWFCGHCILILLGFQANSILSTYRKNAKDLYCSASLLAFNSTQDVCIVRRCIQQAVDMGLVELEFCPNPEDYVDGRVRELRPAFVTVLQQFLSLQGRENWLRDCLKDIHRNAEPFRFVGISIQLIAFVHETYLKMLQVPVCAEEEAASEIRDDYTVAKLIAGLFLGPFNGSEAKSGKPVSFIRRVMMELRDLYNAKAIEMIQNPEAKAQKEVLAQIGMTSDKLKILLSDWY